MHLAKFYKINKVYMPNSKINVDLIKTYINEECIFNKYFVFETRFV